MSESDKLRERAQQFFRERGYKLTMEVLADVDALNQLLAQVRLEALEDAANCAWDHPPVIVLGEFHAPSQWTIAAAIRGLRREAGK